MVNAGELLIIWLVFWNMNFIFSIQLGIIILTDELIFFRGVGQPPTITLWLIYTTHIMVMFMATPLNKQ